jgi:succinate dehydrogenase hydrophobic anchor subunit
MTTPTAPATRRRFLGRPEGLEPGFVPGAEDERLAGVTRSRAGRLWMVQAATGAVLLGFLGLHIVAQHFLVEGGLRDYDQVVSWLRQPVVMIAELGLAATVIVHVVLGLRVSLVELVRSPAWLARWTRVLALGGVAAFAYFVWLTWLIVR